MSPAAGGALSPAEGAGRMRGGAVSPAGRAARPAIPVSHRVHPAGGNPA